MLFNSFSYILFLPICVILYYLLPHKLRWVMLLIASCIFYMAWHPVFIILILFSTICNFIIAKQVHNSQMSKKNWLILILVINFGLLFIFKYAAFLCDTILYFWSGFPVKEVAFMLPVGISFYTFQAAGYNIDIFQGRAKPQNNFFKFLLFIVFFPQLVAGPIERANDLMPRLFSKKSFSFKNIETGGKYLLIGFFKKIVIADRLAVLVNKVYNNPHDYDSLAFIIATILFAFQIYCDFSGYSNIAVGSAKMMGIDLTENFKQPYLSSSVKEFWRRWHITLSLWFKDYVYIPLGGSRKSKYNRYKNLMITFVLSGLWHGANWTFVMWGALNGFMQVIEDLIGRKRRLLFIGIPFTFIAICFTWIFFRANTIGDAFYIVGTIFSGFPLEKAYIFNTVNSLGLSLFEVALSVGLVAFLIIMDIFAGNDNLYTKMERSPFVVRFAFYFILAAAICGLGVFYNAGQFIYFQF